ncbi:MAG: toxin-antitoxin system HicB family antitoxin [Candidatus Nanopelagicales bacterium]
MHLDRYVDGIARQMALAAAAGGPEAESIAERLVLPLRSAVRLALLESLSAAADELTLDLAPGSVELRLRGGEPSFVIEGVTATPAAAEPGPVPLHAHADAPTLEPDEGASARINLRMPDSLKARVEAAALREGRSVNAWLVRAASAALEHAAPIPPSAPSPPAVSRRGSKRVTGWAQ